MNNIRHLTYEDWVAEGKSIFGPLINDWKFVCPACGHVASAAEWKSLGGQEMIGFSCIGRLMPKKKDAFEDGAGPCNYAGGGLLRLNPVHVNRNGDIAEFFEFARAGRG